MRQIIESLPEEDLVYFGDTARVPYGSKSRETIARYSMENTEFLLMQRIKLLVVACNTASAYAVEKLRQTYALPVVDVIAPSVKKALEVTHKGKIGVLGTRATIQSGEYPRQIKSLAPDVEVFSCACPLFVPLVEENYLDKPATRLIIEDSLATLKHSGIDTLILGCTHYPLLADLIKLEMGPAVTILDSARAAAEEVLWQLERNGLRNNEHRSGKRSYFVSDDPGKFLMLGESFMPCPMGSVEHVDFSSILQKAGV